MSWYVWVLVFIGAYLVGSIPSAYILVKLTKGIDIRKVGSGNVGATNTLRNAGKGVGALVLLLDAAKGAVVAAIALGLGGPSMAVLAGVCGFLGHVFPVWLGFKGGKGVAITFGIILVLAPMPALITLGVWLVVLVFTGYVSIASCTGGVALVLSSLISEQYWLYTLVFLVIVALVFYLHRSNFAKVKAGTEHRVFRR